MPPPGTAGHELSQHSADSASISQGLRPSRGISSSRMTSTRSAHRTALIVFFCTLRNPRRLSLGGRELGIAAQRAELCIRWTKDISSSNAVNLTHLEQNPGRVMHLAGKRSSTSVHSKRESVRAVPPHVRFLLKDLAGQVAKCRRFPCAVEVQSWSTVLGFDTNPTRADIPLN